MRIVFLASSYPRFEGDGAAPFVQSLAENLQALGHDVEVVAPYDPLVRPNPKASVRVRRFRYTVLNRWHIMGHGRSLEADVRLRPGTIFLLPFYLLAAFITLFLATRKKTDIIYNHWVIPNGVPALLVARLRRIPLAISLHGSDMYVAKKKRAYGLVASWVLRNAHVITACSPDLRNAAISLGASEKTVLLAWGADPQRFKPLANRLAAREHLGWQSDQFTIISLGRMVYKKGFQVLVQAMPAVIARHPQARLILFGGGPLRNELTQVVQEMKIDQQVTLPGPLPWSDVPAALASADLFVLPSIHDRHGNLDGLPTVLLEAMSCGLPVVASRIAGIPLVIENNSNGILVPPEEPAALAESICQLIEDKELRTALSSTARKSVENEFNWLEVARKLEGLFQQAVRSNGR